MFEHLVGGEHGHGNDEHGRQDEVGVQGHLNHGHERRQRRPQHRRHHGRHAQHDVERLNRSVLFRGVCEPTDSAPSAAADDQRRSDQADRQPQPECRCVGHQLENGEGDERADRQLAEHGTVEGVVADAQYAGGCQRG